MSIETLKNALPEYAKDQKLNLGSLAIDPSLTQQQLAGCFIVSALASRNATVIREIVAEFAPKLSAEALTAAKAAASVMGMNNIYYRFTHLVGGDYPKLPAKLRMNVMARPGVDKVDCRPNRYRPRCASQPLCTPSRSRWRLRPHWPDTTAASPGVNPHGAF